MEDAFNLQRFVDAQEGVYKNALKEISQGRKTSHWMWFVFPQFAGLGSSAMAQKFAIYSREEAKAYLQHPILGARLQKITQAFLNIENTSALEILGSPDHLKMKSSMTLFNAIENKTDIFMAVLSKFYQGEKDLETLQLLSKPIINKKG